MTDPDDSAIVERSQHNRAQTKITVDDPQVMVSLLGAADEFLKLIERSLTSDIMVRGNEITITGVPADNALAERLFAELIELIEKGGALTADSVRRTVGMLQSGGSERPAEVLTLNILSRRGRNIRPKTLGQRRYVDAIDGHTIVFTIGPAGTGKTYLAMAKAVQALQAKQVTRIILTRPAVEAGERLGYLPGTLYEKIDPYLRPLYDALHDMIDPDSIPRLIQSGTIEVAPLAYMRGRAQPVFSRVLTPSGYRPIGALAVGDLVIGSDGRPTPVLGVYPQGEQETYRVTAQDGASTLCSADHLWAVHTRDDRRRGEPMRVLETRELVGRLRAAHHRYELPLLSQPVAFPSRPVPVDPYALGLLLGGGCLTGSTTPTSGTAGPELAVALEAGPTGDRPRRRTRADDVGNPVAAPGGVVTIESPLAGSLRELGLWGTTPDTTFVPDGYRYNSADVRLAVLQGLLDSGGGPVTRRDRSCRVQYTTTSPRLRDHVMFLVRSLGGVVYRRAGPAAGRLPGRANGRAVPFRHDAYPLDIRLPAGVVPFRLPRKLDSYLGSGGGGRPLRHLHRIEPAGAEESVCIQVAAADSLYLTEDFLLTHNTLNDAFILLDEAQNTTAEQMKMFLTRLGFGSKIVVTGDITQIDLPGGARSGLRVVREILEGLDDVHFSLLGSEDVVRHQLVSDIVDAYAKWDANQELRPVGGTGQGGRANRRR
jgi:phosphate starvation-inducible PhoH-like protein